MRFKLSLFLFALFFAFSALGAMPAEKRKTLEESCEAKNAKACEAIGIALMSTDQETAGIYFRKACDYGNQSSCVFYDSKNPRGKIKVEKSLAPNIDPELRPWMEANIKNLMLMFISTDGKMDPKFFNLDQCRIPMQKQVDLYMKKIPSLKHKMKFESGCDAQGTIEIRLAEPFPVDLKVRNLDKITRLQAEAKVDLILQNGVQLRQDLNLSKGILYNANQAILAKFSVNFERSLDFNMRKMTFLTSSNSGVIKISEYEGKPVKEEIPFTLVNIDRVYKK